jgi:hypothetical protein
MKLRVGLLVFHLTVYEIFTLEFTTFYIHLFHYLKNIILDTHECCKIHANKCHLESLLKMAKLGRNL